MSAALPADQSRSMRALIARAEHIEPLLLTPDECAVKLRLAPRTIHHLLADGQLRCVLVGHDRGRGRKVRRVPVIELQRFVDSLPFLSEQS